MNKRGIQLSVNFLVMIIISLVVFSFGVKFIYDMVSKSSQMLPVIDQQIHNELKRLITGNKRVAIAFNKGEVKRGKPAGFGLGILNVNPHKEKFKVIARCEKYAPLGATSLNPGCPDGIVVNYDSSPVTIKNNDYYETMILVKAKNAPSGNYVIYVYACSFKDTIASCPGAGNINLYDNVQKIFVTVP